MSSHPRTIDLYDITTSSNKRVYICGDCNSCSFISPIPGYQFCIQCDYGKCRFCMCSLNKPLHEIVGARDETCTNCVPIQCYRCKTLFYNHNIATVIDDNYVLKVECNTCGYSYPEPDVIKDPGYD